MIRKRYQSNSESATIEIAQQFAAGLKPGNLVLLFGDLGAGKTLFTRAVVSYFDQTVSATSPTFSLVNVYPTIPPIYHLDLYRIQRDAELIDLGFEEYLESDGIVLVEWGEKCEHLLSMRYIRISFTMVGDESREIVIEEIEHAAIGR
jgi:tRNA threonylcarbamoyladenosine biosynthesis protein TsaE